MSTQGRRKNTSVSQRLSEDPFAFQFFQAVRLLERSVAYEQGNASAADASRNGKPVARFVPPKTEVVRFRTQQSLSFPAAEIVRISRNKKNDNNQWQMMVSLLGLTGVMGVLPYHYTELILQRHKMKDESLSHFFDLFNHRTISLFYQAASKYRLPIEYERKKLHPPLKDQRDSQTQALLSLIGLGTGGLTERQYTRDESLLYYSGLLSQQIRSSSGLAQILQQHFNIPVKIQEFIGQWQELIDDVRTMLPSRTQPAGRNNCLGRSVMLGRKGWFAQGKFRVILGPLNSKQLHSFAPGTSALRALNELVRFYAGLEYDYDFVIRIKRSDIPDKIKMDRKNPPVMGWNTWLSGKSPQSYRQDETLDITVTASRFR